MKREVRARLQRAKDALDRLLYVSAQDGSLRDLLTKHTEEAREAMSEDDRARLDAEIDRTNQRYGLESDLKHC
jgi:hypothetical protein